MTNLKLNNEDKSKQFDEAAIEVLSCICQNIISAKGQLANKSHPLQYCLHIIIINNKTTTDCPVFAAAAAVVVVAIAVVVAVDLAPALATAVAVALAV